VSYSIRKRYNEIIGAIIINTKSIIPWDAQALPVWCARQVGSMIDSALTMDPQVNDMARKIADAEARANQVRTYKHMLHSLVHHEGSYCDFLDRLIADLGKTDVPEVIRSWKALVEYTCDDRRQLVSEFQHAPVNDFSGEANAVLAVAPTDIFDRHQVDISVAQITTDLAIIERLFDSPRILIVKPPVIGPKLSACGALPSLKPQVLRRIFSNLYRNTLSWAKIRETKIKDATLEFFLEVDHAEGATELTVVARDNCGGIEDAEFPFGSIRVQAWMDYLNDLEKKPRSERKEVHGMGFLTIARYVEATGGEFSVRNWSDHDVMGTEITIRLGLKTERP
jgi:hypothetical protein